jgi:hypothetical protein
MTEDVGKVKLEWRKWVTSVHLALRTLVNLRAVGQGLRLSHGTGVTLPISLIFMVVLSCVV